LKTFNIDFCQIEIGNIETSSLESLLVNRYLNARKIILVDENTHDCCLEYLITTFPTLEEAEVMLLPVGEENKVMEVCFQVWEALSEYQITRNDLVINLGGGVVTDMGGFIASIYKRGLDFIHIPTSLLGMVDAAIGGKTGIDLGVLKNQLGVFQYPQAIFIDQRFLATLPENELVSGFAEMLKHALIADGDLWNVLKGTDFITLLNSPKFSDFIAHSVALKVAIVAADPYEKGERKKLNFGHTIGHGIESVCLLEEPISHGHAVALGMIAESYLSYKLELIQERELVEITTTLSNYYDHVQLTDSAKKSVIELIQNDKKNDHTGVKCVLLKGIGEAQIDVHVSNERLLDALHYIDSVFRAN
jgi:3-dehydroquinate synthase